MTSILGFLGGKNLVWGIGEKDVFFKKLATTTALALLLCPRGMCEYVVTGYLHIYYYLHTLC